MFSKNNYNPLEFLLFPPTWLNETTLENAAKGKTILITGASFGIGEKLAYQLAKTGANLILVARTEEKLVEIKNKIGGNITIFACDLTKTEAVENLINELKSLPNGIDVFVNNAGKSIRRPIYESLDRFHDFQRTMALNYFAPVQLLLGLIPILEQNKGQIINVSAVNVLMIPAPFWAAYQSSKTAFDQWFRCISPEVNASDIITSTIYLPLVRTRMIAPTEAYKNAPAMSPNHVATIICKTIYTHKRKHSPWWLIFGQIASVIFRRPIEFLMPKFVKSSTKFHEEITKPEKDKS
jgi:short-subunit dehydrogenase